MSTPAAASDRPTLRSFWQDLPREGQLLLSIVVFEFLGTGHAGSDYLDVIVRCGHEREGVQEIGRASCRERVSVVV